MLPERGWESELLRIHLDLVCPPPRSEHATLPVVQVKAWFDSGAIASVERRYAYSQRMGSPFPWMPNTILATCTDSTGIEQQSQACQDNSSGRPVYLGSANFFEISCLANWMPRHTRKTMRLGHRRISSNEQRPLAGATSVRGTRTVFDIVS